MNPSDWTTVDTYLAESTGASDPVLEAVLDANAKAGLPAIDVSPVQGRLLQLLTRMCGARRVLEIGTLGGYSSICMARALPTDGCVITLEYDPAHAKVARANIERAGLADRVEIRVGPALDTLPQLTDAEPFDLVFIDADKASNPDYLAWALRLSHPGTVIVLDNVVREGRVVDADSTEPAIVGTRRALEMMGAEKRLTATAIQMVGGKGWDGFAIAIVD